METKDMKMEDVEARLEEIRGLLDAPDADLTALNAEVDQLTQRKADIIKAAEERKALEAKVLENGTTVRTFEKETKKMADNFAIDTLEYRNAWVKSISNRDMSVEERAALTAAGAVIPTMTVNAVWDKLIKPAELLNRVDVSQFPNYVRFPKATTVNAATGQAVGTTITESSDVVGYTDLTPFEYVKLLTVGADIEHMSIGALHDWIVDNLVGSIRAKINADVLVGAGTAGCKGITATVSASATALPAAASLAKKDILAIMAALDANYHQGAIWIMTPSMFYSEIMPMTQLNDYVINDGCSRKLFGHDVVLMSEALVSSKENVFFGDPKAYKLNIFKAIEVKPFETATTTNIQWRGATMADGELIDANAFVRFARA